MKQKMFKSLLVMAAIMALCTTLFSCRDDEADYVEKASNDLPECYIDKNDLSFDSKKGDVKELRITCSGKWEIANIPEWLEAESKKGMGCATVKFTTSRDNQTSFYNEGCMTVTFTENPEATGAVQVKQRGSAVSHCGVSPNLIVTLSNGIACDFTFDRDVARYYRGYIEASSAGRMTDGEIINTLEQEFQRHVPGDDEVANFDGLKAGTRYIIYTLGYDRNGNRGELVSTAVTTLAERSNEPIGKITDLYRSGYYWYWSIAKSATCNSYYMMASEDQSIALASDVLQAWWLEYAAKRGSISEYVNGADWRLEVNNGSMLAVWTRGVDSRGNLSSVIDWACTYPTTTRSGVCKKSGVAGEDSGHKLSPEQYRLYKVY